LAFQSFDVDGTYLFYYAKANLILELPEFKESDHWNT